MSLHGSYDDANLFAKILRGELPAPFQPGQATTIGVIATDATGAPVRAAGKCRQWDVFVFLADRDHVVFRYVDNPNGSVEDIAGIKLGPQPLADWQIDEAEAEKMAERMAKGQFDMNDLRQQLRQMQKMGGLGALAGMMPGMKKAKAAMAASGKPRAVAFWEVALPLTLGPRTSRASSLKKGESTSVYPVVAGHPALDASAASLEYLRSCWRSAAGSTP